MEDFLSKKERVLLQKPKHVIDASVLFGLFDFEERENKEICERYLKAIDHKYKGFTTIPLLGETLLAITKSDDSGFREKAYDYLTLLIKQGMLEIIPIKKDRDSFVGTLSQIHQHLKEDDITHLSNAIHGGHTIFITLDTALVGEKYARTRQKIRDECNLEIFHPKEMIGKLNI